jgi:hypothetical protein
MRRIPRSRWTYVAAAVTFGVVVYIVVHAGAALSLSTVGLGVAMLLSAAAAVGAHRPAVGLEAAASRQTEQAREERALVGQLSASALPASAASSKGAVHGIVLTSPTNSGAVAVRDLAGQIAVAAPVVR